MEHLTFYQTVHEGKLRPAFGSGEDWNSGKPVDIALNPGCARPSGRARIGTAPFCVRRFLRHVAPGLRVGRGLEQERLTAQVANAMLRPAFGSGEDWNTVAVLTGARPGEVAPGLRVGRGLELVSIIYKQIQTISCARPSGRARIGTWAWSRPSAARRCCARPSGRARIGTGLDAARA